MLNEFSEYIVLGIGLVISLVCFVLKKEHARIDGCDEEIADLNRRLSNAINDIAKNNVADNEWRKRVEENHKGLLKADEDRRGDARKIYDKISRLETATHKEMQRLGEKIAGKR